MRRWALLGWLSALSLAACKSHPAPGELVVLLSSDMQVPDSFDTVILTAGSVRRVYRADPNATVGIAEDADCDAPEVPQKNPLRLPATVSIISDSDTATSLSDLRIVACSHGRLVFSERFAGMLPEAGEIRQVRVPIRWLCRNRTHDCYSCGSLRCYQKNITTTASNCVPAECAEHADAFETAAYDPTDVAAYTPASSNQACFNVPQCFAIPSELEPGTIAGSQIPVDWHQLEGAAANDDDKSLRCLGTLQAPPLDWKRVNVALVVPNDRGGYCDGARCLVALDSDTRIGWKFGEGTTIEFPPAVCHMLDSGQILYVVSSETCPKKNPATPICEVGFSDTSGDSTDPTEKSYESRAQLNYGFDIAQMAYPNEYNGETFDVDSGQIASIYESDPAGQSLALLGSKFTDFAGQRSIYLGGVDGDSAGFFNNQRWAKSTNEVKFSGDLTASVWVSLTDQTGAKPTEPFLPIMPIISNLSDDCMSGLRLELRTCTDDPTSVVAVVGRPYGKDDQQRCNLQLTYAPLARRSFAGGYFTPWNTGNWYHLAVAMKPGVTKLYVDGKRGEATIPTECLSTTANTQDVQSSDGSHLVVGANPNSFTSAPSRTVLIDEVKFYPQALTDVDVARFELQGRSRPGASGFRWGVWGTQGGYSIVRTGKAAQEYQLFDAGYSSTGVYAELGQPRNLARVTGATEPPDLSGFDEAVLVIDGQKYRKALQFALTSDHGSRQCTWHLPGWSESGVSPADITEREAFVIDLHHPSWCVTPNLTFDMKHVERVSLGTDWTPGGSRYKLRIAALAFRKRNADPSSEAESLLGGVVGPSGWYWKSVAYEAAWTPQPVQQLGKSVTVAAPVQRGAYSAEPELAADLPDDLPARRDFSACRSMQVSFKITAPDLTSIQPPMFVMQNESGQNWSVNLPKGGGEPATVDLAQGTAWPTDDGGRVKKPTLDNVLPAVTRVSIRSSSALQVDYVKCCDASGTCHDI